MWGSKTIIFHINLLINHVQRDYVEYTKKTSDYLMQKIVNIIVIEKVYISTNSIIFNGSIENIISYDCLFEKKFFKQILNAISTNIKIANNKIVQIIHATYI